MASNFFAFIAQTEDGERRCFVNKRDIVSITEQESIRSDDSEQWCVLIVKDWTAHITIFNINESLNSIVARFDQ